MAVSVAQTLSALLTVLALLGTVAILAARLTAARVPLSSSLLQALTPLALPLAALVAVSATAGSLFFSEVASYIPCRLCWFQRIAMFPLAVILPIAAWYRDRAITKYVVPITSVGVLVSVYHAVIEWFPSLETTSCSITAPCTAVWFRGLGVFSLAMMAAAGFITITTLLLATPSPATTRDQ